MYARIENDVAVEFPIMNIRQRLPQYSFPEVITDGQLPPGFVTVTPATSYPSISHTQRVVPALMPEKVNGKWILPFVAVDLTPDELESKNSALKASVVNRVQERLDAWAKTRGYDGILSACTYATDPDPVFQAEGQRAVEMRSATWAKTYEILAEIVAGTRPIPPSYQVIEPELPTLTW